MRLVARVAVLGALVLVTACVGATTPPPAESTTTTTAAEVRLGTADRDAALARARRRLEVAAREIGVLERELPRRGPDGESRRRQEDLRRAEQKRAELDADLSRLAAETTWSPERGAGLDIGFEELDVLLERARK